MSFGPLACANGFANRPVSIFPTFAENPCGLAQAPAARKRNGESRHSVTGLMPVPELKGGSWHDFDA
jgi:hypothetical protein